MRETIDVQTGEVKASRQNIVLCSKAIGSCIAVVAYDSAKKIGALAHVMLPGRAQAVGGTERRCVSLDVGRGIVYCSEGNGSEMQLWGA